VSGLALVAGTPPGPSPEEVRNSSPGLPRTPLGKADQGGIAAARSQGE